MYGIIDIGSNTVRLCVYKVEGKQFSSLFHHKISAGLANYRRDNRLTTEGIQRATNVLRDLKHIADNLNIKQLFAFATASLRNISNSLEAKNILEKNAGIPIDLLSGEEEGRLGFKGAMHNVAIETGILADIGGGSTELVSFSGSDVLRSTSIPMGSLSMYLNYVSQILPSKTEMKKISKSAAKQLKKGAFPFNADELKICGVGGTFRALNDLGNFLYGMDSKNKVIKASHLKDISNRLIGNKVLTKDSLLKVCPDRVHTILPGIAIASAIVDKYDAKEIIISRYGVREGYLVQNVIEGGKTSHA